LISSKHCKIRIADFIRNIIKLNYNTSNRIRINRNYQNRFKNAGKQKQLQNHY
jgi:hypothetical protein